jgi:K+-sensing histidine kinase KdpD
LNGETVNETISEMTGNELVYAVQNNIKTMLETPIFIHGELWGLLSFDKHHEEKLFNPAEVTMIKNLGDVFAHAIRSNEARSALRLQREAAEAANQAKTDFISRMNHEIHNPMNAVINMAEIGLSVSDSNAERKNYAFGKIRVKDTGIGIDPQAQTRVFEPFVQEKSSISRIFGGTGLGLAITKSIVDLMGGFEATKAIRSSSHPAAKTIPIIAMTANVLKEDSEKCLSVGMNDHIGKPFDADVIFDVLEKFLGQELS